MIAGTGSMSYWRKGQGAGYLLSERPLLPAFKKEVMKAASEISRCPGFEDRIEN
jgi:hypothetical protein